jgi:hypothetical protein
MADPHAVAEANRLYWQSDASVAEIAARFDLSRRALYQAVEPVGAGVPCAACGRALRFENRLARQTGAAVCAGCGAQQVIAATHPVNAGDDGRLAPHTGPATRIDSRSGAGLRGGGLSIDGRAADIRGRAVWLGSAAIAGLAIGGVAAWLARRRD